eukprot:TRINITY_DN3364_c0_g1_i1.p1 TRINITY_DN3364_c0_g1~~TRINITY_DN3364_c0_g1_i1.p1  ORF type:complete len:272 (+),score=70.50 TRINITY_DN3364_c0_g1_i1:76-816(+)
MAEESPAADTSWLVDLLVQFTHTPSWTNPLKAFIDEKCIIFDNFEEENKHEYVEVHKDYKDLVDNLLAAHLLEVDILPEDFERQCQEAGLTEDPRLQEVLGQLLAAEDFLSFKQLMVETHTNQQLQAENTYKAFTEAEQMAAAEQAVAMAELAAAQASRAGAPPAPPAPPPPLPSANARAAMAPATSQVSPHRLEGGADPTDAEERAFNAGGGFYGRGALPTAGRRPAGNDKAAAIRKALVSGMRR